jgi:hypothetical protein
MTEGNEIIAKMLSYGGGEEEPINLDAYLNNGGLITIRIDDDRWIELSAIHAKRFRERLNNAIGESLARHLSPTE